MSDQKTSIRFEEFTGGMLETNSYLLRGPTGNLLIDAPPEADSRFASDKVDILFLTHGHFDHIMDAAAIKDRHNCHVMCHPETIPMISDPTFFRNWGFSFEIQPIRVDSIVTEQMSHSLCGIEVDILEVPGHCPGSLCLYFPSIRALFGGDVLFQGSIGRADLPGGDIDLLLRGIREKILTLPDDTRVFPGHGPATSIAEEMITNPWLQKS